MKGELDRAPRHFTGPEWVDKKEVELGQWPASKLSHGTKSRIKSTQTSQAKAGLRTLQRLGLLK